jgi:CheY-like chemotaxis protein
MDLQMPEMNGFEATDYIRNTLHSNIPIIALTADVTTVDLAKCKAVGMNDYIAKPVDERVLYSKIVGLVRKPLPKSTKISTIAKENKKFTYTDFAYLKHCTNDNPVLMLEMISAYLEQTPLVIEDMKHSFATQDWHALNADIHKILPSFSIMGFSSEVEGMAKRIQDFARNQLLAEDALELTLELELICTQAYQELELEYSRIENMKL